MKKKWSSYSYTDANFKLTKYQHLELILGENKLTYTKLISNVKYFETNIEIELNKTKKSQMHRKNGRHYSRLCTLHQYFTTGGKPSTWFPPGGLIEHTAYMPSKQIKYHNNKTKTSRWERLIWAKPSHTTSGLSMQFIYKILRLHKTAPFSSKSNNSKNLGALSYDFSSCCNYFIYARVKILHDNNTRPAKLQQFTLHSTSLYNHLHFLSKSNQQRRPKLHSAT